MSDLILLKAERLCLMADIRRAEKQHKATAALRSRLIRATARVAAMEGCGG